MRDIDICTFCAFVISICVVHSQNPEWKTDDSMNKDTAMKMLKKYSYMGENHPDPDMRGDEMYEEALKNFQRFANIELTGVLDNATMTMMMSPRCGMADLMDKGSMMKRRRRYAIRGTRWKGTIGYNFKSFSKNYKLSPDAVKHNVKNALSEWQKYTERLKFEEKQQTSDVEISFETLDHGDGSPLDGRGMSLGHAFYPARSQVAGDVHFDDDENWTVSDESGTNFYSVALHELGHSLGLLHSMVEDAVMYPYYHGKKALHSDDIRGIQVIYGSPASVLRLPTNSPDDNTTNWRNSVCANGTVDAIGTFEDKVFAFQGELYVMLDQFGIAPGYPRKISDDWEDSPNYLDAAMTLNDDHTFLLFKDEHYWRYEWNDTIQKPQLVHSYPRKINQDFIGGLPRNIDASFPWSQNGLTYIIKDNDYYRVWPSIKIDDSRIRAQKDRWYGTYPKDFGEWGISDHISDVFMYHGRTFFFAGDKYYRYNDHKYKADAGYPKSTAEAWFGCRFIDIGTGPEMEMDMMERESESQFEAIPAGFTQVSDHASTLLPANVILAICVLIIRIFNY